MTGHLHPCMVYGKHYFKGKLLTKSLSSINLEKYIIIKHLVLIALTSGIFLQNHALCPFSGKMCEKV